MGHSTTLTLGHSSLFAPAGSPTPTVCQPILQDPISMLVQGEPTCTEGAGLLGQAVFLGLC